MLSMEIEDFVSEAARTLASYAIEAGEHLMITGPRGSGKTELVAWAARKHGRPFQVCHLGASTDIEATLQGTLRLKNAETCFHRASFVGAVTTPYCVICLDEMNRSGDPKAQGMFLPCMDGQKRIFLDQEDDPARRVVEIAEGVIFVGTCNVGSAYHGTDPIDAALRDRMLKMRLPYSSKELEVLKGHGLGDRQAREVMSIAKAVRSAHEEGILSDSISTRGLEKVAKMLCAGFDLFTAVEAVVGPEDDEAAIALHALVQVQVRR